MLKWVFKERIHQQLQCDTLIGRPINTFALNKVEMLF